MKHVIRQLLVLCIVMFFAGSCSCSKRQSSSSGNDKAKSVSGKTVKSQKGQKENKGKENGKDKESSSRTTGQGQGENASRTGGRQQMESGNAKQQGSRGRMEDGKADGSMKSGGNAGGKEKSGNLAGKQEKWISKGTYGRPLPTDKGKIYGMTIQELRPKIKADSVRFSEGGEVVEKKEGMYAVKGRCSVSGEDGTLLCAFEAEVVCFGHIFEIRDVTFKRE